MPHNKNRSFEPATVTPIQSADRFGPPRKPEIHYPEQWQGQPLPERKWIIDGAIPARCVTLISGDGGLGKSLLALQLQAACAFDKQWLGLPTRPCKTLGMYCEDDLDELHRRMYNIARHYGRELGDFEGQAALMARPGLGNGLAEYPYDPADWTTTDLFGQLTNEAVNMGAEIVIIDSLHDVYHGNENIRPMVRHFINSLHSLALEIDGAVIVNAHPSRAGRSDGSGESGSTAWNAAVRSRLYLEPPKKDDGNPDLKRRVLSTKKANYAPLEKWDLEWRDGVFVRIADVETAEVRSDAERRFLDCLDAALIQGRHPSPSSNASSAYAPKMFARMPQANGCSVRKLSDAMERLFSRGEIRVDGVGKGQRKQCIVRCDVVLSPPLSH